MPIFRSYESTKRLSIKNLRNIMALSLELSAISNLENNENLTFFVDSFDSDDFIDPSSSNFSVNTDQGYVGLTEGGALKAKDTTSAEFSQGTFTDTEVFTEGSDDKVRKEVVTAGGINLIEDFDDLANVATTGDATQSLATNASFVKQGTGSVDINVNFTGTDFGETSTTTITLGANLDISTDSFLNVYYLKKGKGPVDFVLRVEDNVAATFDYPLVALTTTSNYQKAQFNIGDITGIDTANVAKFHIVLTENTAKQIFIDFSTPTNPAEEKVTADDEIDQTFTSTVSGVISRIGLNIRREADVTEDLHIAISNYFGTTLATTKITALQATETLTFYILDLSQPILIPANTTLKIQLQTDQEAGGDMDWRVEVDKDAGYADGEFFANGALDTGKDLTFTLYKQPPSGSIYFDQLEREGASVFEATGSFLSRGINLGVVPNSLDLLSWIETLKSDDIQIRVRFASTLGGLTSATWSALFTDPTGAGNDLSSETPNQWFQYEIQWSGGTTADSSSVAEVVLDYSVNAGTGSADVRSIPETTGSAPTQFMVSKEDEQGSGSITYYMSADGGTTWQNVTVFNELEDFNHTGTSIQVRAVITGDAKVFGWSVATDEEFI